MKQSEQVRKCVLCESIRDVQRNHQAGRNHVAWYTGPLCLEHHNTFHLLLRRMGVDLESTPDPVERILRAWGADLAFQWMLREALTHQINKGKRRPK